MAQGFQLLAKLSVVEEETGHIFQHPQPFPQAIKVSINKAQHYTSVNPGRRSFTG
jgi:hypothetical protein